MKTPAKTSGLIPLAPLRWKLKQPKPEKLCSDMELVGEHLWLFNRQNVVYRLSLDGQVEQTWQLPNPIERFLVDGDTLRVFDNTGTLFDLSRKEPRPVSQLSRISPLPTVLLHRGSQVVLGSKGVITAHDARGKERWSVTIKGANPRAFCVDKDGIYVSAGPDIHALDWSGSLRWKATTGKWAVWRLWQSQSHLYVTTTQEGLRVFDKTGEQLAMSRFKSGFTSACACDDKPLFLTTGSGRLKAWSDAAEIEWELKLDSGLVCSSRVRGDTVYVMSYEFGLVCVDISEQARAASARQKLPATTILQMPAPQEAPAKTAAKSAAKAAKAPAKTAAKTTKTAAKTTKTAAKTAANSVTKSTAKAPAKSTAKAPAKSATKAPAKSAAKAAKAPAKAAKAAAKAPAKAAKAPAKAPAKAAKAPAKAAKAAPRARVGAAASASAVTVECFQDGNEIRVRVVSKGYNRDWSCQFPRHLRVAGARYKVDGVVASAKGGFYRVVGDIHRV